MGLSIFVQNRDVIELKKPKQLEEPMQPTKPIVSEGHHSDIGCLVFFGIK